MSSQCFADPLFFVGLAGPILPSFGNHLLVPFTNVGTFYRYINKRMNHHNPIAALTDSVGSLVVSDSDKANLFNQYYSSVGVVDNGIMPNRISLSDIPAVLDSVIFTKSGVCKAINKLKSNLSSGPDDLPHL